MTDKNIMELIGTATELSSTLTLVSADLDSLSKEVKVEHDETIQYFREETNKLAGEILKFMKEMFAQESFSPLPRLTALSDKVRTLVSEYSKSGICGEGYVYFSYEKGEHERLEKDVLDVIIGSDLNVVRAKNGGITTSMLTDVRSLFLNTLPDHISKEVASDVIKRLSIFNFHIERAIVGQCVTILESDKANDNERPVAIRIFAPDGIHNNTLTPTRKLSIDKDLDILEEEKEEELVFH